jgi:hypothetical protein
VLDAQDALEALDAAAVRRWSAACVAGLREHQVEIDTLNVFPVRDRDTGTNLLHTIAAADVALAADPGRDGAVGALRVFSAAAVLAARGNSGVIVAQLLRSLADAAEAAGAADADAVRDGLARGATEAREAVADPVGGTILSVSRAAADAVPPGLSLGETVRLAVDAASAALLRTTDELPQLRAAGVVDAGGRGYLVMLDALAQVVTGEASRLAEVSLPDADITPDSAEREAGSADYGYEVQYLLDTDEVAVAQLRSELGELGDCVVVVGTGAGTWNVHVHVNDVGAAMEAGVRAGRPYRISVTRFTNTAAAGSDETAPATSVVAVAPGNGLSHLFASAGVSVVEAMAPTAAEVLAVLHRTGSGAVVLLPNGPDARAAAEQAATVARETGIRVAVVSTRSPVQGLAAVAVHDPSRGFDDDVVAMAEAAGATRFAEITVATAESLTSVGICQPGDVLGMIDGEVVEIGRGVLAVLLSLTDRLLGVGAELLTVLVGSDAPPGVGELLARHVRERAPFTEVTVYAAGQPRFPVIIGVE